MDNPTVKSTTVLSSPQFLTVLRSSYCFASKCQHFPLVVVWEDGEVLPLLGLYAAFIFASALTGCLPFPMF